MSKVVRFTTRRLLMLTVVFALAFAVLPGRRHLYTFGWQEWIDWEAFLLTLLSSLAAFGLSQQIRDLWQLRRKGQINGTGLIIDESCHASPVAKERRRWRTRASRRSLLISTATSPQAASEWLFHFFVPGK
jgi:hypothetical protein